MSASNIIKDPNTNWKYLLIVFILGVLVGGGILAWQFGSLPSLITPTPTPPIDETADWKTYRNEEYGFEMKYPKDWTFKVTDPAYWCQITPRNYNCLAAFQIGGVHLVIYDNPNGYPAMEWLEENNPYNEYEYFISIAKTIKIGGQPGVKIEQTNGRLVTISYVARGEYCFRLNDSGGEIFNQILSTFQFLE